MRVVAAMLWLCAVLPADSTQRLVFAAAQTTDAYAAAAVLEEAYGRLGIDIEVDYLPGLTALTQANAGMYDGDVQRVAGLERQYHNLAQLSIPVNYLHGAAFSKRRDVVVAGWYSLRPYRIGIVSGIKFAEAGTRGMDVRVGDSYVDLLAWVEADQIDFAIMPVINGLVALKSLEDSRIQQAGVVLETLFLYHYVNKKHQELVPRLEKVLNQMLTERATKRIRDELYADLLGIEVADLERAGTPSRQSVDSSAPIAARQPGNESRQGATKRLEFSTSAESRETEAAAAVLREAYRRLGYEIELRKYEGHSGLSQANAGLVDGELMRIDGLSRRYDNLVQISIPLNYAPMVVFARDADFNVGGWNSLQPYRIGIVQGVLLSEQGTRGMDTRPADSFDQLVRWLANGKIDVAVTLRVSGLMTLRDYPDSGVRELPGMLETIFLYHYLHSKNTGLVRDVERVLKSMLLDGTLRNIHEQSYATLLGTKS